MTGTELKAIREAAGHSQGKLGKMLKTFQTRISLYERGAIPIPEDVAEKVAILLPAPKEDDEDKTLRERAVKRAWTRRTEEYIKAHPESPRKRKAKGDPTVKDSLTVPEPGPDRPVEVRMCSTVELGPQTMRALSEMIREAVREMAKAVKPDGPEVIRPEVIAAAKDGDRYRAQCQEVLGRRGW